VCRWLICFGKTCSSHVQGGNEGYEEEEEEEEE
jgi:hypothetical protein